MNEDAGRINPPMIWVVEESAPIPKGSKLRKTMEALWAGFTIYRYNRNPEGIMVPRDAGRIDPMGATRKAHYRIKGRECKHCMHCNKWLTLDNFYKHRGNWDKLDSSCKKCSREMIEHGRR